MLDFLPGAGWVNLWAMCDLWTSCNPHVTLPLNFDASSIHMGALGPQEFSSPHKQSNTRTKALSPCIPLSATWRHSTKALSWKRTPNLQWALRHPCLQHYGKCVSIIYKLSHLRDLWRPEMDTDMEGDSWADRHTAQQSNVQDGHRLTCLSSVKWNMKFSLSVGTVDSQNKLPEGCVPVARDVFQSFIHKVWIYQAAGLEKKIIKAILALPVLPEYLKSSFFTHLLSGLPVTSSDLVACLSLAVLNPPKYTYQLTYQQQFLSF